MVTRTSFDIHISHLLNETRATIPTAFTREIRLTQPITYNEANNCSCGLQSNCVTQAAFTWPAYVEVKGLLIGCLPSQSLLASTLECFFDIDCINLIRAHMDGDVSDFNHNIESIQR